MYHVTTQHYLLSSVETQCDNKLLLEFSFEHNFGDVTCHGALAASYGDGDGSVQIVHDAERDQNVAEFDGNSRLEASIGLGALQS